MIIVSMHYLRKKGPEWSKERHQIYQLCSCFPGWRNPLKRWNLVCKENRSCFLRLNFINLKLLTENGTNKLCFLLKTWMPAVSQCQVKYYLLHLPSTWWGSFAPKEGLSWTSPDWTGRWQRKWGFPLFNWQKKSSIQASLKLAKVTFKIKRALN